MSRIIAKLSYEKDKDCVHSIRYVSKEANMNYYIARSLLPDPAPDRLMVTIETED